jgi:site-specific DNA-cytosine methylase
MVSLRVASLFSGIGGLDQGLARAGHRIVLMCERDEHCKQVLAARFPGVPLLNDVAEVLPFMIEQCDLIAAGFPCNDCSHENLKRPGLEEGVATRNVAHVFRLLESVKVPWVLLENVCGLLTWNQQGKSRPAIDYVVSELENLGYRWAYRVVNLASFGLPHQRRRVFIVASLHGDPRDVLLSQSALCQGQCISMGEHRECFQCFWTPPRMVSKYFSASIDLGEKRRGPLTDVLHCLTTTNGRRTCVVKQEGDAKPELSMLRIEDAERLMGFTPGYTLPCYPLKKPNERQPVYDEELQTFKRFALLGLACSVPQSQWLGAQLFNPYGVKFTYDALSEPFEQACPGGAEAHARAKAWPQAAYNMLEDPSQPKWMGRRRAPPEVGDAPLIRGFVPLGEFFEYEGAPVRYELRASYLRRLEISHDKIDETIRRALDVKASSKKSGDALESPASAKKSRLLTILNDEDESTEEDVDLFSCDDGERGDADDDGEVQDEVESDDDLDEHGMTTHGECVFVKWRVSKAHGSVYWPGIALHPLKDHAVIPNEALKVSDGKLNDEHRLVIFFGGRTFAWKLASDVFPFASFYSEAKKQSVFKSKNKYEAAIEEARAWCTARNLSKPQNPIVVRNIERLFKAPEPCMMCDKCATESVRRALDDKPQTRRNRVLAASKEPPPTAHPLLKSKCAQLKIIELARGGHIGAVLALRKANAVGQRVLVLWHTDAAFYSGTITSFDEHKFVFRVDYDDGDVDAEFKPWEETVMLAQDVPSPAANAPSDLKKQHARAALEAQISKHAARRDDAAPPLEKTTMRHDAQGRPIKLHK